MKTKILFEDQDVLVIQKPAGLATQTLRVDQQDVVSELKNYLSGSGYLGIVHRLDQPVEGLLVFGKTKSATASLTAQLKQGNKDATLNKHYYCVICGKVSDKVGQLVDYLYKDATGRAVVLSAEAARGDSRAKRAVLQYHILQEAEIPAHSDLGSAANPHFPICGSSSCHSFTNHPSICLTLADVQIDTGRFHQIRAQMAHGGMHLLGDAKYNDDNSRKISEQLGIRNVALCAYSLEFTHPATKKKISFQIKPQNQAFSYFSL